MLRPGPLDRNMQSLDIPVCHKNIVPCGCRIRLSTPAYLFVHLSVWLTNHAIVPRLLTSNHLQYIIFLTLIFHANDLYDIKSVTI